MNMTQEREAEILETVIKEWGPVTVSTRTVERMAGLVEALTKYMAYGDNAAVIANLKSAMADVSIMLNMLELIFGPPDDEEIEKLERLERRIQDD